MTQSRNALSPLHLLGGDRGVDIGVMEAEAVELELRPLLRSGIVINHKKFVALQCLLLARSTHALPHSQCLLSGVEQT